MEKVLFLDIDGVLGHFVGRYISFPIDKVRDKTRELCSHRVQMLANFVVANGLTTIVCSTWRKNIEFCEGPHKLAEYFLDYHNVDLNILDYTIVSDDYCRGTEIREAIVKHQITSYVILDDDGDFHPEQFDNHVAVSSINGLVATDLIKATKILKLTNKLTKYTHLV